MTNKILSLKSAMPEFKNFDVAGVSVIVDIVLEHCKKVKEDSLSAQKYTWQDLILPIIEAEEILSQVFSKVSHLNTVANNSDLRIAYECLIEKISAYETDMGQDKNLYDGYKKTLNQDNSLTKPMIKFLNDAILSFERSGVALDSVNRDKFKQINMRLSQLENKFNNNVLDSTMAFKYHTLSVDEIAGISKGIIIQAEQKAKALNKDGYILGLDAPTYIAVMQQADNRELREKFYKAYSTRATEKSDDIDYDNSKIIDEILKLKNQKANLLSFENYSEYSLKVKMANDTNTVELFLNDLLNKSSNKAKQELKTIQDFAIKHNYSFDLQPWDLAYFSEKLKKDLFSFNEEELKCYFPEDAIFSGLFTILKGIYGLTVKQINSFDSYNSDVKLYEFYDKDKNLRGKIICDIYARDNKNSGAWMDVSRTRFLSSNGETQTPVAYLCCNFMPAENSDTQALLTHNDVVTLFHEFGHALHHILSKVDILPVSGVNGLEWDAIELPSQFMENFCWCKEGLKIISKHYKTNEAIPDDLIENLIKSRSFNSGLAMLRQVEFSMFDLNIHSQNSDNVDVALALNNVRKQTNLLDVPEYNRFQNSFCHIFAGGYSSGYYSYKWAEVLSSDAFAMFEESDGGIISQTVGLKFLKEILEKGGSEPAIDIFKSFRGRTPENDALLRHSGIK